MQLNRIILKLQIYRLGKLASPSHGLISIAILMERQTKIAIDHFLQKSDRGHIQILYLQIFSMIAGLKKIWFWENKTSPSPFTTKIGSAESSRKLLNKSFSLFKKPFGMFRQSMHQPKDPFHQLLPLYSSKDKKIAAPTQISFLPDRC